MGTSQSWRRANSAPERAPPTKMQTGFQFLTKDFLRFWTVDIHREGCSQRSAPQKRHKAHGRWVQLETGVARTREVIRCTAPKESALPTHLVA